MATTITSLEIGDSTEPVISATERIAALASIEDPQN